MTTESIPAGARIGHVHLKVADLDRAVTFYRDTMGFDLVFQYGSQAAFLSAGGYHHHIGLNTWESAGGTPPPRGTTGLYHFAINYPERSDLATALRRLLDHGWGIDGASDHGTHEALYLHDPDFNGIELAWDRSPDHWYRDGKPVLERKPLDFPSLLGELADPATDQYLPGLAKYD
jgi:catechol 2,3-dioxygenase